MHFVALLIAGFMTLLLAGPALRRGGLIRAWVATFASVVPAAVLYLGYFGESPAIYLAPMFIMFSITLAKASLVLMDMVRSTPQSIDNVPVVGAPHWAA